jgi:hypothetical protein
MNDAQNRKPETKLLLFAETSGSFCGVGGDSHRCWRESHSCTGERIRVQRPATKHEGHLHGRYATAFLSAAVMCECTGRDRYRERSIVHKEVVVGVKAFY